YLDLRLYQYGWEQCEPLHSFGPSVRNHYLFHYILSGQGWLDSTGEDNVGRRHVLSAGQGFLISPGQVTTYCAAKYDPWKYVWLEFDGLKAAEFLTIAGLDFNQPVYRPRDTVLGDLMGKEMLYITDHAEASSLHLIGHLCLFLDALVRSSATQAPRHGPQLRDFYIQEAVTFMEQNYQRNLTVEEIANVCRLNRSYFSKLFKDSMGCSPQEFLIRLRLSKAAELMRITNSPIGGIAMRCGYPDQLHFSRAFKKRYGMSPREWRNHNRKR
ncbi:MAG: AraC family transcriptional regulator, partial [Oscillibacter sp.]|nr:AraC family transcriptional regulator [Oscillibacter sp.]